MQIKSVEFSLPMASKSHFSMPLVIMLMSSGNQSSTGSKEADGQCWTKALGKEHKQSPT